MPIYMDRHDVSESVTAEHVAQLHQADLKIQDQFGCRGLTYWFDDKRKTAFCLIEAPDAETLEKMHAQAHGQIPHSIIEVDAGIVESFLGRIEDPEKAKDSTSTLNIINDPAFRIIMVIESQKPTAGFKEAPGFTDLSSVLNNIINERLFSIDGTVVSKTANQLLVSFKSVTRAVNAACDIQLKCRKIEGMGGSLKIAMSAGIPVTGKKSFFEDSVNLANRMCVLIHADITLSADAADLYKSENANTNFKEININVLKPADEKFITLFMDYLDLFWSNSELKVDDFSKPTGSSKSQLYRKLTRLTGKSPNAFLKEYRLNKALQLLTKNKGNISEIAFETGFTSPSYFSKCFQIKFGHAPSDFLPKHEQNLPG